MASDWSNGEDLGARHHLMKQKFDKEMALVDRFVAFRAAATTDADKKISFAKFA